MHCELLVCKIERRISNQIKTRADTKQKKYAAAMSTNFNVGVWFSVLPATAVCVWYGSSHWAQETRIVLLICISNRYTTISLAIQFSTLQLKKSDTSIFFSVTIHNTHTHKTKFIIIDTEPLTMLLRGGICIQTMRIIKKGLRVECRPIRN